MCWTHIALLVYFPTFLKKINLPVWAGADSTLVPECLRTRQKECAQIRLELAENSGQGGSVDGVFSAANLHATSRVWVERESEGKGVPTGGENSFADLQGRGGS
jgi:hypothetical protein